jgi:hypothetical protein
MTRLVRWFGLVLLFVMLAGCVRESTNGDEHLYRYELWASGLVFLAGVIATPVGWPIAALGFAPSMFLDRVAVRPEGFSRHSGIWGMTAVQEVKFANIGHMQLAEVEERGRRGRKVMRTYLLCDLKTGESARLPAGNEVVRAALPAIIESANKAGVMVGGIPTE